MNFEDWICQDITFCMSKECKKRDTCHRAIGCKKRIASYTDYYEKDKECKYYIAASDADIERNKNKQ